MAIFATIKKTRSTPIYNIGMASRLCGLPIYTLRWVEQHNLIHPHRTEGNQRLFSDADMDLLQQIRDLLEQDVNLSGIRIILQMKYGPQDSTGGSRSLTGPGRAGKVKKAKKKT